MKPTHTYSIPSPLGNIPQHSGESKADAMHSELPVWYFCLLLSVGFLRHVYNDNNVGSLLQGQVHVTAVSTSTAAAGMYFIQPI
jgi:hypothetical protein